MSFSKLLKKKRFYLQVNNNDGSSSNNKFANTKFLVHTVIERSKRSLARNILDIKYQNWRWRKKVAFLR